MLHFASTPCPHTGGRGWQTPVGSGVVLIALFELLILIAIMIAITASRGK